MKAPNLKALARAQFDALRKAVDGAGMRGVKGIHDASSRLLERTFAQAFRGRLKQNLTRNEIVTLAELTARRTAQEFLALGRHLVDNTAETLLSGAARAAHALGELRGSAAALEQRERIQHAADMRKMEIASLRGRAAAEAGVGASRWVRAKLGGMQIAEQRVDDAIEQALELHSNEYWRVVRVAKTEAAYAFNAAQDAGFSQAGIPGLYKRWTERVNDQTGEPMDSRVGIDSIVLHGQLALPGGTFVMPPDSRLTAMTYMVGRRWSHPPNRPNDRSVITPWTHGCGVPGWQWDEVGARRKYF